MSGQDIHIAPLFVFLKPYICNRVVLRFTAAWSLSLVVCNILQPINISTDESKINKRIEFIDIVRNLNQFLSRKGSFLGHNRLLTHIMIFIVVMHETTNKRRVNN